MTFRNFMESSQPSNPDRPAEPGRTILPMLSADERADVVADLSLIPSAFMEIACEMPTQFLSRRATCDVRS
jgi:hypothetical protein